MTDLNLWPEAWLQSPIKARKKIEHGWTLLTLDNNEVWLDINYDLIKIKNEEELNARVRAWGA